jgi:hypothetical protein
MAVQLISRATHLSPRDPRDWFSGLKTARMGRDNQREN